MTPSPCLTAVLLIALPDLGLRAAFRVIWEINARMEWSPLGARDLGSGTRGGGMMGRLGE